MEKLIELLNEYEPYIASDGEHKPNLWGYAYQGHSAVFPRELAESYIISAHYGFIKWLVENDKIDRPKVWLKIKDLGDDYGRFAIYSGIHIECLLMLLSISDTPIEDLISYLK